MTETGTGNTRAAGWVMMSSAILSILLMANHPSGASVDTMATPIVHGGLQFLILLQVGAMVTIWRRLDGRLLATVALVAFIAGQSGALIAASINGFVVPELWSYPKGEIGADITSFAWELNQAFARLGAITTGVALALFGAALWRIGHRIVGAIGSLIGSGTALLLITGILRMDIHGALAIYLSQLAWLAAFGVVVARKS